MSNRRRKKASDIFKETEYLFGNKVSFDQAFPEISDLKIYIEEVGEGTGRLGGGAVYGKDAGEYINCSNPLCYKGGFAIGKILRNMVHKRQQHDDVTLSCQGYEGSPKGRVKYQDCENYFKASIDIEYKPET